MLIPSRKKGPAATLLAERLPSAPRCATTNPSWGGILTAKADVHNGSSFRDRFGLKDAYYAPGSRMRPDRELLEFLHSQPARLAAIRHPQNASRRRALNPLRVVRLKGRRWFVGNVQLHGYCDCSSGFCRIEATNATSLR